MLEAELARVESHQPFPPLDTVRYQLPVPISTPASDDEWQSALKNAHAQLEHQRLRCVYYAVISQKIGILTNTFRQTNLTLLQTYGPNAWRIHNYLLESTAKQTEKALEELKELTVEVNRDRKNTQVCVKWCCFHCAESDALYLQTRLGNQLNSLETRWTELISSVLQIEMANVALDAEVERLNKKETELADV